MRFDVVAMGVGIIAMTACSQQSTESGCTKDTDCKGDRVCQAGQCVSQDGALPDAASNDGSTWDASGDVASFDSSGDSMTDAGADVDGGCIQISGATACGNAEDNWCTKAVSCSLMQSVQQCRAWLDVNFPMLDCSISKYNKSVCADLANKCATEESVITCGTVMAKAPDQTTATCMSFFGQF